MIDFHTHSTASDGQYQPAEVIRMAASAGINTISLTDHDTVDGTEEAYAEAKRQGIGFLTGVEVSCSGNSTLHILGHGFDHNDKALLEFLREARRMRDRRNETLERFLKDKGVNVTVAEAAAYADGGNIRRPHFARAMIDKGYAVSVADAFDRYLNTPEYYALKIEKPSPKDCIGAICAAGGCATLAHPYQLELDDNGLRHLLNMLCGYGLNGMECYYPRHTSEMTEYYCALADEYGLYVTAGSDFHGEKIKPDITLGTSYNSLPEPLKKRVL